MLERTKKRRTDQQNGYVVDTDIIVKNHSCSGKAVTINKAGAGFIVKRGAAMKPGGFVAKRGMTPVTHIIEAMGDCNQIHALKVFAKRIGLKLKLKDPSELVSLEFAMPEMVDNRSGVCLRGGRVKEDMTQIELSKLTGISQRHISEMENGKRPIGKETAKKFGEVLNIDYRVFL